MKSAANETDVHTSIGGEGPSFWASQVQQLEERGGKMGCRTVDGIPWSLLSLAGYKEVKGIHICFFFPPRASKISIPGSQNEVLYQSRPQQALIPIWCFSCGSR
jgi:hypothetical protein